MINLTKQDLLCILNACKLFDFSVMIATSINSISVQFYIKK